jgi:hypothetical protein
MGRARRKQNKTDKYAIIGVIVAVVTLLGTAPTSWLADALAVLDWIRGGEPALSPSPAPGASRPSDTHATPSVVDAEPDEPNEVLVEPVGPGSRCSKPNGSVHDIRFRACVKVEDARLAFAARLTNLASTQQTATIGILWVRNDSPPHSCEPQVVTVPAKGTVDTDWAWCVAPRIDENAAHQAAVDLAPGDSQQWQASQNSPVAHVYVGQAPDDVVFTCGGKTRC